MVTAVSTTQRPVKEPRLSYLVARLDRLIRSRLSAVLEPFDVSVPQYTVLSILERRADLSNAQLARRSYITAQAMHQVVNGLQARNLVERATSSRHGRIQPMRLTTEGATLLRRCDEAVEAAEQQLFDTLGSDDRQRMRALIEACIESAAGRAGGAHRDR
jgi:DNA-binding MarR family transcriptional regulator